MKRSTALAICLVIIALAALYSLVLYPSLPNPTPSHWGADGKINGYSSPLLMCVLMPAIMLGLLGFLLVLPKMSPKKFEVESWARVYNIIMVLTLALQGVLHVVTLNATKTSAMLDPKYLFCALFVFFAVMGNFIGKVRRNFWVGVRTPWTLSNETVWNIVHRRAGQLWVVTGILGAILSLLGMSLWFSFGFLMVAALIPVVHSYFVWKRVEGGTSHQS